MRLISCLIVLFAISAPDVRADGAPCRDVEKRRRQADEFLAAGAHDDAIAAYEAVLRECGGRPRLKLALTFNIGLAYQGRAARPIDAIVPAESLRQRERAIADRQRALVLFRAFLAGRPTPKVVAEVKAYIARLEDEIVEQTVLAAKERDRIADEAAQAEHLAAETERLERHRRRERARRRRLRIGAYATLGVAAAAAGTSMYYGMHARTLERDLAQLDDWSPASAAQVDEGHAAERRAIILGVSGGVAVAAGALLLWISRDQPVFLAPTITPTADGGVAGVTGTF